MPAFPRQLPLALGPVFTAAEARAAGLDSRRLHAADVVRLAAGVYARHDSLHGNGQVAHRARPDIQPRARERGRAYGASPRPQQHPELHPHELWRNEVRRRAAAFSAALRPDAFYSHSTAGALWGLPIEPPSSGDVALEVAGFRGSRTGRYDGVTYRAVAQQQVRVVSQNGLRVTDPATTWAQLSPGLPLHQAVALGDAVLWHPRFAGTNRYERPPLATRAELEAAAATPHRRGGGALRALVPSLSHQSASPPESHLRVALTEWGLPPPSLDHDVRAADGKLLGCSELAYPTFRLALEYEGAHHFSQAKQFARDIEKYQDYTEHGWQVLRVTSKLLYRAPRELRRQLTHALRQRGWGT